MPTTADINYIEDKNGDVFFPVTHVGAVIDDDNNALNSILDDKVSSSSYDNIVSMSKTDFDALATKDGRTMYIVDDPNEAHYLGNGYRLIASGTVNSDAMKIEISQDSNGNALSLSEIAVYAKVRGNSKGYTGWTRLEMVCENNTTQCSGSIFSQFAADGTNDYYYTLFGQYKRIGNYLFPLTCLRSNNNQSLKQYLCSQGGNAGWVYLTEGANQVITGNITKVRLTGYADGGIGAGTEYWIWGIDA